jgi:hypothetical protein
MDGHEIARTQPGTSLLQIGGKFMVAEEFPRPDYLIDLNGDCLPTANR